MLIGISTDSPQALMEWARDDEFPFLFASDEEGTVGRRYGAFLDRPGGPPIDNRSLFIVDPEGRIAYVAAPFREIDPTAYEDLGAAIARIAPPIEDEVGGGGRR